VSEGLIEARLGSVCKLVNEVEMGDSSRLLTVGIQKSHYHSSCRTKHYKIESTPRIQSDDACSPDVCSRHIRVGVDFGQVVMSVSSFDLEHVLEFAEAFDMEREFENGAGSDAPVVCVGFHLGDLRCAARSACENEKSSTARLLPHTNYVGATTSSSS